jgi:hypothetical protein
MAARKEKTVAAVLTAETGQLKREMTRAGGMVGGFAKRVERAGARMRAAMRNTGLGNVTARLRSMGPSIAAFAGIYGIGAAIKAVKEFEESLDDLRVFGKKSIEWMDRARKQIVAVSNNTGMAKDQLADFANRFVELTGDADAAMGALGAMGKVAVATRSDMASLAQVMEQITGGFNLKGAKQIQEAIGIMAFQAFKGAMSFKDIAQALPMVVGAAGALGAKTKGMGGVRDVGAILQIAKRGMPTGMVSTAVMRYIGEIAAKRGKLEAVTGQELTTTGPGGERQFKSLGEISKILAKAWAEADIAKRAKLEMTMEGRGRKVLRELGSAYRTGWTKTVGSRAAPSILFEAKGAGAADIERMYAEREKGAAHKITKTMTQLTNQIHTALLPAFQQLAELAPTLGKGLAWVIRNVKELIIAWAAFKGARFFSGMRMAAGGAAAMAARGGGMYGPGGQVAAMYGGAGGQPGAPGAAMRGAGPMLMMAANRLFLAAGALGILNTILDSFVPKKYRKGFGAVGEEVIEKRQGTFAQNIDWAAMIQGTETKQQTQMRAAGGGALNFKEMVQGMKVLSRNIGGAADKIAAAAQAGVPTTEKKIRAKTQGKGKM